MPRGPAPPWRARKEPVLDAHILASVEQAGGIGHHDPETGHYAELVIRDLATREEAAEWSRALHRSAYFMSRHGVADVSVKAKISKDGKGYKIVFRAVDKTCARAYVLATYGEDRSKWPYDPRRRGGAQ